MAGAISLALLLLWAVLRLVAHVAPRAMRVARPPAPGKQRRPAPANGRPAATPAPVHPKYVHLRTTARARIERGASHARSVGRATKVSLKRVWSQTHPVLQVLLANVARLVRTTARAIGAAAIVFWIWVTNVATTAARWTRRAARAARPQLIRWLAAISVILDRLARRYQGKHAATKNTGPAGTTGHRAVAANGSVSRVRGLTSPSAEQDGTSSSGERELASDRVD